MCSNALPIMKTQTLKHDLPKTENVLRKIFLFKQKNSFKI